MNMLHASAEDPMKRGAEAAKKSDVPTEIRRLIAAGASVSRSGAVQLVVANEDLWPHLDLLLELEPGALNAADSKGHTPLHVAAGK